MGTSRFWLNLWSYLQKYAHIKIFHKCFHLWKDSQTLCNLSLESMTTLAMNSFGVISTHQQRKEKTLRNASNGISYHCGNRVTTPKQPYSKPAGVRGAFKTARPERRKADATPQHSQQFWAKVREMHVDMCVSEYSYPYLPIFLPMHSMYLIQKGA